MNDRMDEGREKKPCDVEKDDQGGEKRALPLMQCFGLPHAIRPKMTSAFKTT